MTSPWVQSPCSCHCARLQAGRSEDEGVDFADESQLLGQRDEQAWVDQAPIGWAHRTRASKPMIRRVARS